MADAEREERMKKPGSLWSAQEEVELIRLRQRGWFASQIAEHIQRSPKAVEGKIRSLIEAGRLRPPPGKIIPETTKTPRDKHVNLNHTPIPTPPKPRGYSKAEAAWALANCGQSQEAVLIVLHLAERGDDAAQAVIGGRIAA